MNLLIDMASVTTILIASLLPLSICQIHDYDDYDFSEYVDARIVGGRPALPGEAPYQLSILGKGYHLCGATLVLSPTSSQQIVITAGHCVSFPGTNDLISPHMLQLRGGSLTNSGGQIRNVAYLRRHEGYHDVLYYDIAVLFLEQPFNVDHSVKPVVLPDHGMGDTTNHLTVSGWGSLVEGGDAPDTLQIVTLPVIPNQLCAQMYAQHFHQKVIFDYSICAGEELGGHDACQGDSGGPAIGQDEYGLYLAGVVSWGKGCAQARTPGVFSRVSAFLPWISQQTAAYESWQLSSGHAGRK